MHLACKHCGQQIVSDDINIDAAIAKCRHCNAVFNFSEEVGVAASVTRAEVSMPKNIQIDRMRRSLRMIRKWFSAKYLFMVAFCLFWDGFLVVWYFIAFSEDGPMIMKVFPILHVIVGLGLTYVTIAGLFNRTVLEFVGSNFVVRHGPIPWPGNRNVRSSEIQQLYCDHKVTYGKHGQPHHRYGLNAVMSSGEKLKLVPGLDEPEQALFLEQEIEKYLDIKDERVPGEMPV